MSLLAMLLLLPLIVPTLRVGMPPGTLCVPLSTPGMSLAQGDAERHGMHSHAERGNEHYAQVLSKQVGP
ncbi:hypothetical protein HNR03_004979 [Pseudomonas sp. JAI111]|uniref:hypothetical protein n=1 Tax=Pseudomonas sp. JAI111 TaxID=2735913 RepID=UPI002168A84B|nr:hypothetical protein [Pseudomonas sp. JAI111]MCS3840355.1 hypothetical protein [Pseudomonas sp. JAI111]